MKIGSLFTGYGGLDMAVEQVTGATTAWVSDIDKGACKILAHRYPDAPNLGDLTKIDWATVEPVDIITGGYPCQPFSHAGRRKGEDDDRHLWPYVREAIRHLRPRLTVLENVAGHRSMGFDRVLGDLAEDGLHARWASLRAADVGAPHRRERLFIIVTDPRSEHGIERRELAPGQAAGRWSLGELAGRGGTPAGLNLLPTPAVNDMGRAYTPEEWDAWTAKMKAAHGNGNGHGKSLSIEALRLLPTPTRRDWKDGPRVEAVEENALLGRVVWNLENDFGSYTAAVRRWETTLGRPAPAPTEPTGRGGAHRLSPRFTEWMMGLPAGWITDVPGITRNEALKACGNGVVPQQATEALRILLTAKAVAA